ncbi:hypothetical protein HN937_28790 [Candidatus Poribacteria bacterium]|jgi:hypothetical protein|nr:hypothetical protein [Candidatus Poribacteria bacterium]
MTFWNHHTDNTSSALGTKQIVRALAVRSVVEATGRRPFVLEAFCGEGHLYRACYTGCDGVAIDADAARVRHAARERPGWACYSAKSEDALANGLFLAKPFDVVDLDAWGSPFEAFTGWCRKGRAFAPVTWLFLTDGHAAALRRKQCANPFLFGESVRGVRGGRELTRDEYDEIVERRVTEFAAAAGLTVEWWRTDRAKGAAKTQRYHTARLVRG